MNPRAFEHGVIEFNALATLKGWTQARILFGSVCIVSYTRPTWGLLERRTATLNR